MAFFIVALIYYATQQALKTKTTAAANIKAHSGGAKNFSPNQTLPDYLNTEYV